MDHFPPEFAYFDGDIIPFEDAKVPIEDRGLQFAESLYEVVPITGGVVRELPAHVERMRRGAELLGLESGLPPFETWTDIGRKLVDRAGLDEGTLYAQLTGGTGPRAHAPAQRPKPTFWAYTRMFRFPRSEQVETGIRAITLPDLRWGRCDVKTTQLLAAVMAKREAAARGADEALLIGPGHRIREGASSNLFLVEGTTLVTPPTDKTLLPGVTRELAISAAGEMGFKLREEPIMMPRLQDAKEVFITSSTRFAMPVVSVDDVPVGRGGAGPVAKAIALALRRRFELAG